MENRIEGRVNIKIPIPVRLVDKQITELINRFDVIVLSLDIKKLKGTEHFFECTISVSLDKIFEFNKYAFTRKEKPKKAFFELIIDRLKILFYGKHN